MPYWYEYASQKSIEKTYLVYVRWNVLFNGIYGKSSDRKARDSNFRYQVRRTTYELSKFGESRGGADIDPSPERNGLHQDGKRKRCRGDIGFHYHLQCIVKPTWN